MFLCSFEPIRRPEYCRDRNSKFWYMRSNLPRPRVSPFAVPKIQSAFHRRAQRNRFPSPCASWSRCRLSSRTDMTDKKPHAGDDNSPRSNHFCQNSWIFGRHCPAAVERLARLVRFRPMKPFLHLFREFREIHLRNSRFSFKHNPIPFDATHRRVFVYFAVSGFEVLRKCK